MTENYERTEKRREVLLVINAQKGFLMNKKEVLDVDLLIHRINVMIQHMRLNNNPIVFIQYTNSSSFTECSEDWTVDPRIKVNSDDFFVSQKSLDVFDDKRLKFLKALNIGYNVVIMGVNTDASIRVIALASAMNRINATLISDGHSTNSKDAEHIVQDYNREASLLGIKACSTMQYIGHKE